MEPEPDPKATDPAAAIGLGVGATDLEGEAVDLEAPASVPEAAPDEPVLSSEEEETGK